MSSMKNINYLFVLLLLFIKIFLFINGQNNHHPIANIIENYPENIRGIQKYDNTYGIVLNNQVILRNFLSFNGNKSEIESIGDIHLQGRNGNLLEFKFFRENAVLICNENGCSICEKSSSTDECKVLSFNTEGVKYSQISASIKNDKIYIRVVKKENNLKLNAIASLYIFEHKENLNFELIQSIDDNAAMSDFTVIESFTFDKYVYFVGSATRIDLPTLKIRRSGTRINTEVRITRLCSNDKTKNLDSRIDIVLSCKGIDYANIDNVINNIPTAVSFNNNTKKLYIAITNYNNDNEKNIICRYDFDRIQKQFDETWGKCQNIMDSDSTLKNCRKLLEYNELKDECFLFTWNLNTQLPYCSSFNGVNNNDLKNCELHLSNSTNQRYGWLENFKPLYGTKVYSTNNIDNYIWIKEADNPNVLFALTSQNKLERLLINTDESKLLMYFPALSGKKNVVYDSNNNIILFIDPRLMTTLNYSHLTCQELYSHIDCNILEWDDPLNCVYCTKEDGYGNITDIDECDYGEKLRKVCPPKLNRGDLTHSGVHITGENLDEFIDGTRKIAFCNYECPITTFTPKYIQCNLTFIPDGCSIFEYSGKLKDDHLYSFKREINTDGLYSTTTAAGKKSNEMKILRIIAFVISACVLIVLPIVLYCWMSKKLSSRLWSKQTPKNNSEIGGYNPVYDIPLENRYGYIENSRISCSGKQIGDGTSSVVYLGSYITDVKNNKQINVAIKKLNCEFPQKEVDVMKTCNHKNIVQLIGVVKIGYGKCIVTEYMGGGSLETYLKKNIPTFDQSCEFIKQILEGMVYLSHQHIIHRDLATRNCLLNETYDLLKISDFGLSRRTNNDYQYVALEEHKLPFRWMPIEVLLNQKMFTVRGDVWSFGVTIWEIFSREQPYDKDSLSEVRAYLSNGRRLKKPTNCPDAMYNIMQLCWDADPSKRPTFDDLLEKVNEFYYCSRRINNDYERPKSLHNTTENGAINNGKTAITEV